MCLKRIAMAVILLVLGFGSLSGAAPVNSLVISEVFYDRDGSDGGYEWIELFNGTAGPVDLSAWSLGWGGEDYTVGTLQLSGTVLPMQYWVLGGPNQDASNGSPVFDLAAEISPGMQNSGTVADGVGLFHLPAAAITPASVPYFSVIYGSENTNGLISHTGDPGSVDVEDAPAGQSLVFLGETDGWIVAASPTPGTGPLATVPIPPAAWVFGSGLFFLVGIRRRSART